MSKQKAQSADKASPEEQNTLARRLGVHLSHTDELEYSASMLKDLLQMANARRDVTRAYFIEMAYIETCDQMRKAHERALLEPSSKSGLKSAA